VRQIHVAGADAPDLQIRRHGCAVQRRSPASLLPGQTLRPVQITHIDEGLDFLGWRIQRHRKRGTNRYYVYTYPSRKALNAVTNKVKSICRQNVNQAMPVLMRKLNPALRGWCAYFRPGVSSATFAYLARYTWDRVLRWAGRKHRRITVRAIRHRYCNGGWWPTTPDIGLFNPAEMRTTRYRYRGTAIPTPWPAVA
jgi:RNA-directed DNA polymerase